MFPSFRPLLAGLAVAWSVCSLPAEGPVIRLRADTWMPYNGEPDAEKPGYVVELARRIFEPEGAKVDYQTMPWTEALEAARSGAIEGVIGANAEEGEGLAFPGEPTGAPQACLMTLRTSTWRYDSIRSFFDVRLGVSDGYSYWPGLDKYVTQPANAARLWVAGGENPLADLLAQLDGGAIEVMVDFEAVLLWELRSRGLKPTDYRVVYKHQPDPIFVAFAPNERGRELARQWDVGLARLRATGELNLILRRYGLNDWQ